jgi:hypothetical protein
MEFDAKPFLDDALEVNPPPPYDTVPFRIGPGFNDPGKLRQLAFRQTGLDTTPMPVESPP